MDAQLAKPWSDRARRAVPGLLLAAVVLTFAASATHPLLHGWDDNVYVTHNADRLAFSLRNIAYWFTHDCVACYLPLTMFSYMVDHAVWGLNAFGYHLQNMVWHAVAAIGLYACCRRLGLRWGIALAVAWLFAVHPQRVESVVWISERKDVLCAAFFFLALNAYLRDRNRGHWPWAAFALFLCAMLSKSMAITLPAVLLIVEMRYIFSRSSESGGQTPVGSTLWRAVVHRQWPFWVVSVVFVPITIAFQSVPHSETTWFRQTGVAFHNLFWYAGKTLAPSRLCPIYPKIEFSPAHVFFLIALCVGLAALAIRGWPRHRELLVRTVIPFAACYAATLSPVSGLLPLGYVDMSDRYSYIPSAFLLLGLGLSFQYLTTRIPWPTPATRAVAALVMLTGGAFMLQSVAYAKLWSNIRTLTKAACGRENANVFALGQLGDIEIDEGNMAEALVLGGRLAAAQRSWMTPEARGRTLHRGLYLQGFALYAFGKHAEALAIFEAIRPTLATTVYHEPTNNAAVWAMMADCYLERGEKKKALSCYDALLETVIPGSFEDHFYRGLKAVHSGNVIAGSHHFEQALALRPEHQLARANLAECRRRVPPAAGDNGARNE